MEQRVADQKRAIEKGKFISESELKQIKEKVRSEICGEEEENDNTQTEAEQPDGSNRDVMHNEQDEDQRTAVLAQGTEDEELVRKVSEEFEKAMTEYWGNDPESRPRIPRIYPNRRMWEVLSITNKKVMPERLREGNSLEELMSWVYCGATTVVRMTGKNNHPKGRIGEGDKAKQGNN